MSGFPQRVKELVLTRSSGMCEVMVEGLCTFQAAQMHHRRPRAAGGSKRTDTNTAANAIHVCLRCHAWAESHRAAAMANGWLIPNNSVPVADPAWQPMLWRQKSWVWLTEDGDMNAEPPQSGVA